MEKRTVKMLLVLLLVLQWIFLSSCFIVKQSCYPYAYFSRKLMKESPSKALRELHYCVKICSNYYPCLQRLGWLYIYLKHDEKAVYYLEKAIRVGKVPSSALESIASFYYKKKDYKKSLSYYKKVLNYIPWHYDVHYKMANIYIRLGNQNKAVYYLEKAIRAGKATFCVLESIASFYYKKKDYKKSLSYYKKVLNYIPWHYDVHYKMANIYIRLGNQNKAKFHLLCLQKPCYVRQNKK